MTLRCHVLGHKRSRSRAFYDDRNACWLSDCKRCNTPLVREWYGEWHAGQPQQRPLPLAFASLRSRSFTILIEQPALRQAAG